MHINRKEVVLLKKTKAVCQLYVPNFFESYGKDAIRKIIDLLPELKKRIGFSGINLMFLWENNDRNDGLDATYCHVNPEYGTDEEFGRLIKKAHDISLKVGVDVALDLASNETARQTFKHFRDIGIDFVCITYSVKSHEDVSEMGSGNIDTRASIEVIREVSDGMPLFFEWLDGSSVDLFNDIPECYALDCSYAATGQRSLNWDHKKLIPLLGGYDQKTVASEGIDIRKLMLQASKSDYVFTDIQTIAGWIDPKNLPEDEDHNTELENQVQYYRTKKPIEPALKNLCHALAR